MIADPTRAWVPVELDRTRILVFDHKATFLLMQRFGIRPTSALYERVPVEGHPKQYTLTIRSIEALEGFLWIGLQRDAEEAGETLTIEQVREFITPLTIGPIFYALMGALNRPLKPKNGDAVATAEAAAEESEPPRKSTGRRRSASLVESSD